MLKSLLYIAILTTVVVVSWIGFSIYHNYTTSTISSDTSIRIVPISPTFDNEIIESLKNRTLVTPDLNAQRQNFSDTLEGANAEPNENATGSAEQEEQTATNSGATL